MKIRAWWSSPNCQHNNRLWLQTSVFGSALSVLSFPSPPPAVKHKKALLCNKWSLGKGRTQKITALWESTNQRKDKNQLKRLKDEIVAVGNQRFCWIPLVQGTFHSQGGFWVSSKVWDQRLVGTKQNVWPACRPFDCFPPCCQVQSSCPDYCLLLLFGGCVNFSGQG